MPVLGLCLGGLLGCLIGLVSGIGGFGAFIGALIGLLCGVVVNLGQTIREMGIQLKTMDIAIKQLRVQAQQASRPITSQPVAAPAPVFDSSVQQASVAASAGSRDIAMVEKPVKVEADAAPRSIASVSPDLHSAKADHKGALPSDDAEPVRPAPTPPALSTSSAQPVTDELNIEKPLVPAVPASVKPTTPEINPVLPPPILPRPSVQTRPRRVEPSGPSFLERGFLAAKAWLFGGNTLVRVGMLLVFLGLAFLLRYASDRIVIPLEVRYLGVACASFVALNLGWRLRLKRPAYALLMQGGSVAIMYLTVFAALKLHDSPLVPLQFGLFLLIAVAALSAILAITQNAMSLAVAGSLGGFAAPALVSTGGGSHVALFSYFALLNTAILAIAWFKAWRPLNLIGFFGTFSIGLSWGMRSYQPEHYLSCQGFLILFFLMFVGIGLLFARRMLLDEPDSPRGEIEMWADWLTRQGYRAQRYVDGTILFGTPLIGFGIQHTLVSPFEYGSAFSALVLGLFYTWLARLTHASQPVRCRLLTETFLALGVVFATLAIPLGLDAEWTSAAWAVEAAGIYWIGHRQHRPLTRAFAVLVQFGALLTYFSHLSPGHQTLLHGSVLGSVMLGLSWLCNAFVHTRYVPLEHRYEHWDGGLILVFHTLGLWCLFLVAPLLNLAEGCAVALALAGLIVISLGLLWRREGWQVNALIALLIAVLITLASLRSGNETLLVGKPVVMLLIAVDLFGSVGVMRWFLRREDHPEDVLSFSMPALSTAGLWFLYLLAPICLDAEKAAAALALAGLVTSSIGLRIQARAWLGNAFLVQLVAGVLFITNMHQGGNTGGVFVLGGSGWHGLIVASLIGLASIASIMLAVRNAQVRQNETLLKALAWMMVFGLGFLSLAVLFVLPWQTATAVWAVCGFFLLWATQRLGLRPAFWFAVALEVVTGVSFLGASGQTLISMQPGFPAFAHSGFWTPIIIALSAFALAWRLHAVANQAEQAGKQDIALDNRFLVLPALLWATLWWVFGWNVELMRLAPELGGESVGHRFLAISGATVLVMLAIARRWRWTQLTGVCMALLPLTIINALSDYNFGIHPFSHWGLAGFAVALIAQFGILYVADQQCSAQINTRLNLLANWTILLVASLALRHVFLDMGEPGSSWRWLGWVLPLVAWLLWSARRANPSGWPAVSMPLVYKFSTTLPLVPILMVWMCMANFGSGGNSAPLPYLPVLNPLDLALILVLFATWRWLDRVADTDANALNWQALHVPMLRLIQAIAFITYTCVVLRAMHHYADLPYAWEPMMRSMAVQASLSIAWSLCAIGSMILGNRWQRRDIWICGAVLVAIVVAKLFLIELSNRGGLERIVSFIGVGVLLLVVGYFAPLPARKENQS